MEKHLDFDSEGGYHDPSLRIEHVQRETERIYKLHKLTSHIIQTIVAESPYKTIDLEWSVFHKVRALEDENQLPAGVTAEDLMKTYYSIFDHEKRNQ